MIIPRLYTNPGVSNRTTPGFIYFIQGESGGLVKIGWATKPEVRMAHMQAHCPVTLRLLHFEPGNGKQERELHAKFAEFRKHGEWFEEAQAILDHIAARKALESFPPYVPAPSEPYVFRGRKPPPHWRTQKRFQDRAQPVSVLVEG